MTANFSTRIVILNCLRNSGDSRVLAAVARQKNRTRLSPGMSLAGVHPVGRPAMRALKRG